MKTATRMVFSFLAIAVVLSIGYTNCAQNGNVGVEGPPGASDTPAEDPNRGALGNPNPGVGDGDNPELPGDPGDLFTRIVNIPINVTQVPNNHKVKLLLVVDNSKSMRFVHERLSSSLSTLIKPLKDFHVEVKIITTSEIMKQSKEDLENQGFSYKSWTYKVGTKPNEEEARILNALPTETFGIYSYGEYHYLNNKYRMKFEPNEKQVDAKLDQLKQMILDISATTNGSNREQGLCNLLLALHDRGPHQFFEKNDSGGVLLISDENDQSFWNRYDTTENRVACRNMYIHGSLEDKTIDSEVTDDAVNFNIYGARYQVAYDYDNDGIIERRNRGDNGGNPLPHSKYSNLITDLNGSNSLACPEEFYNKTILGYAAHLARSAGGTNPEVSGCKVIPTWSALYNFATYEKNICIGEFSKNGKSYSSFAEYLRIEKDWILVPGSCSHRISKRAPYRNFGQFYLLGSEDPETQRPLIRDAKVSQASIKAAIMNQAKRLFGKEKFFMGNLVHKDNACIVNSAIQSVGVDYANLFQGTPFADRIVTESICTNDYSPVLQGLSAEIVVSAGRTYKVDSLKPFEVINRIFLKSGASKRQLNTSEYEVKEKTITLDKLLVLVPGDILEIEILSIPE